MAAGATSASPLAGVEGCAAEGGGLEGNVGRRDGTANNNATAQNTKAAAAANHTAAARVLPPSRRAGPRRLTPMRRVRKSASSFGLARVGVVTPRAAS
jgi:pyruvate/2-oxoglutarate dehydrogenase complex dihydrolipoamide acyltransferase (E2) component